jgi:hypothetical protein
MTRKLAIKYAKSSFKSENIAKEKELIKINEDQTYAFGDDFLEEAIKSSRITKQMKM